MVVHSVDSPLGPILLAADEQGLTGLWFEGQKYFAPGIDPSTAEHDPGAFHEAEGWLSRYFAGMDPGQVPKLHLIGTPFRVRVWNALLEIPRGTVVTYGMLARKLAAEQGIPKLSARAVGSAVGHNPVSIMVPCHRVLGSGGSLTGYAGGLERKRRLLELEEIRLPGQQGCR